MACRLIGAKPLSEAMLDIVNWPLGNKLQWNLNRNLHIFIEKDAFENVVKKLAAICLGHNVFSQECLISLGISDLSWSYDFIKNGTSIWGILSAHRVLIYEHFPALDQKAIVRPHLQSAQCFMYIHAE